MAIVRVSSLLSEISGNIGGSQFVNGAQSQNVRQTITPLYKQSLSQVSNRSIFSALSSQWSGLTETERDGWNRATLRFPLVDRFGKSFFTTGLVLFVRVNSPRARTGRSISTTPPVPAQFPQAGIALVTANASTFTIQHFKTASPASYYWMVYASLQKSVGVSNLSPRSCRYIGSFNAPLSGTNVFFNEYLAGTRAGQISANQKIFVAAYLCPEIASVRAGVHFSNWLTT